LARNKPFAYWCYEIANFQKIAMENIYSTGASGTIGKHLPSSVESIKFDLSAQRTDFSKITFDRDSNLIHLAGIVGPSEVSKNIEYSRSVNIEGTIFLAEQFIEKSDGIFYFISTSHVYSPSTELLSEKSFIKPINIYAEQKLEAEHALESIFCNQTERLCIIRVFSVLDWDTAPFTLGGAIRRLANNEPDFKLENASDVRDFLTPHSIASALHKIASRGSRYKVLNLCSGVGTSVGEAANRMLQQSGFELKEEQISVGNSKNPYAVGDNSVLKSLELDLNLEWLPSSFKVQN
jgi:nucleoside-diphosphate-sugar epimerase